MTAGWIGAPLAVLLVATSLSSPPSNGPAAVPLPSDDGPSLFDAWTAAWDLANATLDGPLSLNYLYGYEAVAGHDDDGVFATKESLTALVEALDGRIQRGGFWHFLFRDAAGALQAVIVDVDGKARQFDAERVGVVSVHDLHGAPRFDTPQAVLDCRRAGADEYLHETGNNYILYVARPVRGVDVEPDWTLFILFASQLDRPGEIEAASCRLDQRSGTIEYVHPDLYALPDEA